MAPHSQTTPLIPCCEAAASGHEWGESAPGQAQLQSQLLGFTRRWAAALVAAVWLSILLIRLAAPFDVMDNDQQRPAAYVTDTVVNGQWAVQHDASGDITSKPPLYTWLAAAAAWAQGGNVNRLALVAPCALATLALALMILGLGGRYFGPRAGLLGALAYLISSTGFKQIVLVRTDPLFALTVMAGCALAWRSWNKGKSWVPFWLAAAAATLTKGPLGLALAAGGLTAVAWDGAGRKGLTRRGHALGITLFVLIAAGWFALAWAAAGQPLIDKMIGRELVGHALRSDSGGHLPGTQFFKPSLYLLSRFFPWSLLAAAGVARAIRHAAPAAQQRRFERYLICYAGVGLAIFSLAPHQRPDHLFPLLPAVAMLAGREMSRWWPGQEGSGAGGWTAARLAGGLVGVQLAALGYYTTIWPRASVVVRSQGARQLAAQIRAKVGGAFPLTHVDAPYALQFYLGAMRPEASRTAAARLLEGRAAAFVVVNNVDKLLQKMSPGAPRPHEVARWEDPAGKGSLHVLSNHPALEYTQTMAIALDDLRLEMDGLHLKSNAPGRLTFWAKAPCARLRVNNGGPRAQRLSVRIENVFPPVTQTRTLEPGASWELTAGGAKSAAQTVRVGLISDCRQAYAQMKRLGRQKAFAGLDAVVVNGDFAFEQPWRFDQFLRQAAGWGVPIFPTVGNHDLIPGSPYPWEAFMNRFGYANHTLTLGPASLILLESGTKRIGPSHVRFLEEAGRRAAGWTQRLLFMHVPPDSLKGDPYGPDSESLLVHTAAQAKLSRVYCGHRNVLEEQTYLTPWGEVHVVTSGAGGEKSFAKDYEQHWLELVIAPGHVQQIKHGIPLPAHSAAAWAHFVHRDLFLARRLAARAARGLKTAARVTVGCAALTTSLRGHDLG